MARRLIGTGTTDSNGRITVSYTGTGAGKLQLVAVNGNLLSETYVLTDCLFYQAGTSEPPTNTWVLGGFTPSYDANGTTLTSTTFATCFANKPGTGANAYDWTGPFAVEFDITNVSSSDADIQLYDETYNATRSFNVLGITGACHVKIENTGTSINYYINDVEKTAQQYNYSMGTCRVGLRGTGTITFKNFMIYQI